MAQGTNTPIGRILGGAQQVSSFLENQQLSPLRRRSAEIQARGQELGLQQKEAETGQFLDRVQRSDIARAAAEFLAIPEGNIVAQDAFLNARIANLEAKGINTQDTAGMFELDPAQRRQAAEATLQIAQQFGDVKGLGQRKFTQPIQGTDEAGAGFFRTNTQTGGLERVPGAIPRERAPLVQTTGTIQPGFIQKTDAEGNIFQVEIRGGIAEKKRLKEEKAEALAKKKATSAARSTLFESKRTIGQIKKIQEQSGPLTTGFAALTLGLVPFSKAGSLRKNLESLKAKIGFKTLQDMRDASPTGGALGQVSERELNFLQAAIANLDASQNEAQFKENLKEVLVRYERTVALLESEYSKKSPFFEMSEENINAAMSEKFPVFGEESAQQDLSTMSNENLLKF